MTSAVEVTAPVDLQRHLGSDPLKVLTRLSSQSFREPEDRNSDAILPYMTRLQSPVRVSFTPSTFNQKRKSRVGDTAKSAIFNYKPLKRGENPLSLKFRAPEATLTSLRYISPWISVTKAEFRDPRLTETDFIDSSLGFPGLYRRSLTDTSIQLSRRNTPALSRADSIGHANTVSREWIRTSGSVESDQSNSVSTEKRVTIRDPADPVTLQVSAPCVDVRQEEEIPKVSTPSVMCRKVEGLKFVPNNTFNNSGLKEPEGLNYYNGWMPPEYSNAISQTLNEHWKSKEPVFQHGQSTIPDEFYKPLVGDRSLFMNRSYPMQPKIIQSDIDQLRLEGRKQFLRSLGQAPVHFSALKNRGTLARPKQKGADFDEAVRTQNLRQFKAAKMSRKPIDTSAVETFRQQRERTYNLQNLAREMINKESNKTEVE